MRRTLDNFQPPLSHSRNYQSTNRFKKGEAVYRRVFQEQTSIAHIDDVLYEVVTKIAEVEDVDPLEVTPPLYEVIDLDALDQIFATSSATDPMDMRVTFPYNGYEVTVRDGGDVSVEK